MAIYVRLRRNSFIKYGIFDDKYGKTMQGCVELYSRVNIKFYISYPM